MLARWSSEQKDPMRHFRRSTIHHSLVLIKQNPPQCGDRECDTEEERMLNLKLFAGQDYNRLLFSAGQEVTAL